jgi:hypothetical protein
MGGQIGDGFVLGIIGIAVSMVAGTPFSASLMNVFAVSPRRMSSPANGDRLPYRPLNGLRVGIGIGRDRVPQHAATRALHNLPGPVTLQARTSDDLLHRAVDISLPDNCAAIRTAGRQG